MVVLGYTNLVKAFKNENENEIKQVYVSTSATDLIRDLQWTAFKEKEFYSVGWDSKLHKHVIP